MLGEGLGRLISWPWCIKVSRPYWRSRLRAVICQSSFPVGRFGRRHTTASLALLLVRLVDVMLDVSGPWPHGGHKVVILQVGGMLECMTQTCWKSGVRLDSSLSLDISEWSPALSRLGLAL